MRHTADIDPTQPASFSTCERGNVAIVFGLSFVPLMLMLGVGIDYGRIVATRSNLQQATDSAALAVAKTITSTTTNQQAQSQAQVYLLTNVRNAVAVVTGAEISADRLTLCLDAKAQIPTTIMKIAHVETLTTKTTACAQMPGGVDPNTTYEIALVLDNSGSMSSSASGKGGWKGGGKSKMEALRDSAKSFVATMFDKSTNVKMSVTPFAAAVRVVDPDVSANRKLSWIDLNGGNSQHWLAFGGGATDAASAKTAAAAQGFTSRFDIFAALKSVKSSWDWEGCFESPKYPLNVRDTAVTIGDPETLFVPFLAPDEPVVNEVGKKGKKTDLERYSNHYLDGSDCDGCDADKTAQWKKLTDPAKYKKPSKDGSGTGPNSSCPTSSTQTILQLTSTEATVTDMIGKLSEGGYTNLHEGFMWGWRTISPVGPFAAGRSYSTAVNRKIIVFMTDGYNNWKSQTNTATGSAYQAAGYYSYNGAKNLRFPDGSTGDRIDYQTGLAAAAGSSSDYHDTSRDMQDELTREACANAKTAGVEIFTIGFSTADDPIDEQGLQLMKDCATNVEHYFKAEDADQLDAAFSTIGSGLGKLRLTK
jgi:Flp pilus assembly protein TadG